MADDTTINADGLPTDWVLYTVIRNESGAVYDGAAFVTPYVVADLSAYATATPETPAASGNYQCQFPLAAAAGNYRWTTYKRVGASPAVGDPPVGSGSGYYDGSTFGNVPNVAGNVGGNVAGSVNSVVNGVAATLPTIPPLGYGPIGTGSVAVNQDYPTAGRLTFRVSPTGPGIAGALVKAYLASEYAFDPNTAPIRGQTLTLDNGAWSNNINLDPAEYVIAFSAPGYEDTFVDLTVS